MVLTASCQSYAQPLHAECTLKLTLPQRHHQRATPVVTGNPYYGCAPFMYQGTGSTLN